MDGIQTRRSRYEINIAGDAYIPMKHKRHTSDDNVIDPLSAEARGYAFHRSPDSVAPHEKIIDLSGELGSGRVRKDLRHALYFTPR
jgi:hypothetical protein